MHSCTRYTFVMFLIKIVVRHRNTERNQSVSLPGRSVVRSLKRKPFIAISLVRTFVETLQNPKISSMNIKWFQLVLTNRLIRRFSLKILKTQGTYHSFVYRSNAR